MQDAAVQSENTTPEIDIRLHEYRMKILRLEEELYQKALADSEAQTSIQVYRNMQLDEAEIKRRITRQYADAHDILYPVKDTALPENSFTVAHTGTIHFTPIDYCLGVVLDDGNGLSYGAHIIAQDSDSPDKLKNEAQNYVAQATDMFSIVPKKITFISARLGILKTLDFLTDAFKTAFPTSEAVELQTTYI